MAWLITILCSCPPTFAPVINLDVVFTYACPDGSSLVHRVEGTAAPLRCATGAGGQMVKVVFNANSANPSTTVYVSGSYQIADGVVTKYYEGGAFRVGDMLYYGLSDHIGSTGVIVSDSGAKLAEMRYTAWGQVRYQSGSLPTDRTYTGQRSYASDFGLMYYNARWYDSNLAHFAQADNIDVKPGDTQSLDRFGYVSYNPVNKNDPTGNTEEGSGEETNNNTGNNNNPPPSCAANTLLSQCQALSASEMEAYYQSLNTVTGITAYVGLAAGLIGLAGITIGGSIAAAGLAIATFGSRPGMVVGAALMAVGNAVAAVDVGVAGVVGITSAVIGLETSGITSNIHDLNGNITGGTVTTTENLLFRTHKITTQAGSRTSLSLTRVTPYILPMMQSIWSVFGH